MSNPFKIFVVEDNEWFRKLLVYNLQLNPDYEVFAFGSAAEFKKEISAQPDCVTLDYRLPDGKGDEILAFIKDHSPNTEVIIISEQEDIEIALDLMQNGATEYLVKNQKIKERLLLATQKIKEKKGLIAEVGKLKQEVQQKYDFQKTLIGQSTTVKSLFGLMEKAIQTNITVTVTGETGTGKEVVAKAIHYNSDRKNKPFIAVNMAAIPSELIESELFGHEKGSFTGAISNKKGKFEEAADGSLFLDEIGEMPLPFQVKLLRVLQEKEVTRIGSNKVIPINCRIIVATHRNLLEEVKNKNFREDLYFRLFGLPIHLPPLRERDKDVILLAEYFLKEFCIENNISPKKLNTEARTALMAYAFPGNIRELKSVIELAAVLSGDQEIRKENLQLNSYNLLSDLKSDVLTMREYEYEIVKHFMKTLNNNTKAVAEVLAIGQTTVYRILKEFENNNQ